MNNISKLRWTFGANVFLQYCFLPLLASPSPFSSSSSLSSWTCWCCSKEIFANNNFRIHVITFFAQDQPVLHRKLFVWLLFFFYYYYNSQKYVQYKINTRVNTQDEAFECFSSMVWIDSMTSGRKGRSLGSTRIIRKIKSVTSFEYLPRENYKKKIKIEMKALGVLPRWFRKSDLSIQRGEFHRAIIICLLEWRDFEQCGI